ncbi:hypothetical protein G5T42_08090 [Microbacterium sp. 4R-513]|uniref:DUF7402 domain-containing protein n=1 Tax=Microbacterium sp. 4R-513 TaxID=2567934 RepID=UPI0013E20222|nr:discoidin domain-containing protein [Microbacterium sp. 4R-513]QIG39446.1 hypothetical protein G5T42_08090 [Microbacterium sp. 4R-513]
MSGNSGVSSVRRRRLAAAVTVTSIVAGALVAGWGGHPAVAQVAVGTAPFINTWLVAGPFDTAVAEDNYGTARPTDGNWARLATATASSTWKTQAVGYPDGADSPSVVASKAIDGDLATNWISQMHNAEGAPSTWPAWDPTPKLTLTWVDAIKVKEIQVFDRHDPSWPANTSDVQRVDYSLQNAAGTTLASGSITNIDPTGVNPGADTLPTAVQGVTKVELLIVHDGQKILKNVGLGFKEVKVLDGDGVITPAAPTNLATSAAATATSSWKTTAAAFPGGTDSPATVPAKAIDGDLATDWVSQMHNNGGAPSTWPAWDPAPTLTLTWPSPVRVRQIQVFDRHDASWPAGTSNVQRVDFTLKNASGAALATGSITSIDPQGVNPGTVTLPSGVSNVKSIDLLIVHDGEKALKNVGLGFKEVRVFDTALTPKAGETFEGKKWEYFDDRTWNRNYDDYQDLYGYFGIKKGIDTRNKYVYAASYVHSATAQDVELRYGSSGAHRAFVNDEAVDTRSTPAEVQKDMKKVTVHLNAGWNKVLLQIKHTYTDDKNANGYPVGQDANVAYLGFYARLSDGSGNAVAGLTYSVTGPNSALSIDTQALSSTDVVSDGARGRGLPSNTLPIGYKEWPYVWNESKYTTQYGVSASRYRLLASGGAPGYTWSIDSGALPAGLTLAPDGTIDGSVTASPGNYGFTAKVTDSAGATRTKALSITVKDRPNRWFELGRVSALSHAIASYAWNVDPNFSADLWAERAKREGHSLVSVESVQQNYYWPSRFADPAHSRNEYAPKDANGKLVDGLKQFELAVKRYGMRFGLYYATEGGGYKHNSSDVFVQNVQDLILRYDPSYLYFDGPQAMPSKNFDAMYSIVRNYGDDIIINANAWTNEYGDVDLRTEEAAAMYASGGTGSSLTKRTIAEPWKAAVTRYNPTPYYPRRDDYRMLTKEMVMNAGRGNVDNNDQSPTLGRGANFDTATDIATRYPMAAQEYADLRDNLAAWWAPAGKPERHESTTGTMPYFLTNSVYTDDGKGNIDNFEHGRGPTWGYATARDNNIYLHIVEGPDGKQGYAGNSLTIGPVADTVQSVSWLNEGQTVPFTQSGTNVTVDLTNVQRDQVDTIIKLVTDNPVRNFPLTNLVATGRQLTAGTLQIDVEGYRTYPALKAALAGLSYSSSSPGVATVSASGVVTAGVDGTAVITVDGTSDGVTKTTTLDVKVSAGKVYVKDSLIGAVLKVEGREMYGAFSSQDPHDYRLEGRAARGGAISLGAADVVMKAGIVDLDGGTPTTPVSIQESGIVTFAGGQVVPDQVDEPTRVAVWAEVTLDGQTVTSNKVFMDLLPSRNVAVDATVTASGSTGPFTAGKVIDGRTIGGSAFDSSKWSVGGSGVSWISFAMNQSANVQDIEVVFNSKDQNFYNTPESMEIQTSVDGSTWTTIKTVTPPAPGTGAYFGYANAYSVARVTQYLRLNFPLGGNGSSPIDLQEVKIDAVLGSVRVNAATEATATASSSFNASYAPAKAIDDVVGVHGSGEWASNGQVNPWIQLTWPSPKTIDSVVLFDRPNGSDNVRAGTLSFSDGSSIDVTGIDDGGAAKEVTFPPKSVTWVRFTVTGGSGSNNGLSEIQTWLAP